MVALGLGSRSFGSHLPTFVAEYAGDTLWAAMVYFGIGFLFPSVRLLRKALAALLFSYCIEISQLYQAGWINAIRGTTLGALVLGHGFFNSNPVRKTPAMTIINCKNQVEELYPAIVLQNISIISYFLRALKPGAKV